jgi:predicted alpha/beta hydrolase family esterase
MTRQLLFVQGGGGHDAHDAWDAKLVDSLAGALGPGWDIRYPRMPNEDDPKFSVWKPAVLNEIAKLDAGAMLVGHSIGATVLVHSLAQSPPGLLPAGVFLIAAPFIGDGGWPVDGVTPDPDLGAHLPAATPVFLYQGGADGTVPPGHLDLYVKAIPQAAARALLGRDHQLDNDLSEVATDILALVEG